MFLQYFYNNLGNKLLLLAYVKCDQKLMNASLSTLFGWTQVAGTRWKSHLSNLSITHFLPLNRTRELNYLSIHLLSLATLRAEIRTIASDVADSTL